MTAKLSDCSLKLYQAFSGLYVGQLHNFQMCSLGHHRIRWQRDNVVADLRQSFTLKKKLIIDEKAATLSHLLQWNKTHHMQNFVFRFIDRAVLQGETAW